MQTPPRRTRRGRGPLDDDDDLDISISEMPKITYERPGIIKPTIRRSYGPMTSTPQPPRPRQLKMVTPKAISKTPKPARVTRSTFSRNTNTAAAPTTITTRATTNSPKTPLKTQSIDQTNGNTSTVTALTSNAGNTKKQASKAPMRPKNIWDKCIDKNPELKDFIDKFNQSLEVAINTPLDIKSTFED